MSAVDRLIRDLTQEAGPVRRLLPTPLRLGLWLLCTGLFLAATLVVLGIRLDLTERLHEGAFLLQLVLSATAAIVSASSALDLGVPGAERRYWTRAAPLAILGVWTAWMLYRMVAFVSDPRVWIEVIRAYPLDELGTGLALASFPGLLLLVLVGRAAPLRPTWAGGLALLAAGSVSSLGALLTCDSPCPIHAVVLHLSPILCVALLGVLAGWLLLRRIG